MAEVVIGRISLAVSPDTRNFRKEVQADADRIEKELQPIQVPVEVDASTIKDEAKKAVQETESSLPQIKVDTELDEGTTKQSASDLYDELVDIFQEITTNVDMDEQAARQKAQAVMDELNTVVGEVEASIALDAAAAEAGLPAIVGMLDKEAKANPVKVPVKVDEKVALADFTKLRVRMQQELARLKGGIKFDPIKDPFTVFTRSSGLRILTNLHKEKFDKFANFDQLSLRLGALSVAFMSAGASATALTGNVLSLGKGLAQTLGIAVALPGVFTATGLALWSIKNAMKDFGKYLPGVAGQMKALKASMSAQFWQQAQQPMQQMVDKLFPSFEAGMKKISAASGTLVASLANGFTAALGDGRLTGMMDSMATGINIAAGGMRDLAAGMTNLVAVGARNLPFLAEQFNKITAAFNQWTTQMTNNGSFDRWVRQSVVQIKALWDVILSTGSILNGLATAAQNAGAATLSSLAATLGRAAQTVNSGPFQAALTSALADVYTFTNAVGSALFSGIGKAFAALGPVIASGMAAMAGPMATNLKVLFDGLSSPESIASFKLGMAELAVGVQNLYPVFVALGRKAGIIFQLIATGFKNTSLVVGAFAHEIESVLTAIQGPATSFMNSVGTSMKAILDALKPAIDSMAVSFADLLTALAPVAASFGAWAPAVGALASLLAGTFSAAVGFISPILESWGNMMPGIAKAWGEMLIALQPLIPILKVVGQVMGVVAGIIVTVLLSAITGILNGISNVVNGVMGVLTGIVNFIKAVFTLQWGDAWNAILQIVTGIWNILLGAFQIWINIGLLGFIKGGLLKLLGFWRTGWQAVKAAAVAVWNGIKTIVTSGTSAVTSFVSNGLSKVKSLWSAGWNVVKSVASAAWGFLKSGVSGMVTSVSSGFMRMVNAVRTKMGELLSVVRSKISEAASAVRSKAAEFVRAGAALVGGIIQGIQDKAGGVIQSARDLASRATDAFKSALGIHSPSRVFRDMAAFIPAGVAVGVRSQTQVAVAAVQSMAAAIASVPLAVSDVDLSALDSFNGKAFSASVAGPDGSSLDQGGDTITINQTLANPNISADDAATSLLRAVKREKMSGRSW